jgi:hypothetical protein
MSSDSRRGGDAIEEGGGHFWVSEDADPFREGEVGDEDQRGFFVKLADQVEQQGAPCVSASKFDPAAFSCISLILFKLLDFVSIGHRRRKLTP